MRGNREKELGGSCEDNQKTRYGLRGRMVIKVI